MQEIRRISPEAEVGTRTIATTIVRKSIKISRSSVQRILRETKQATPMTPMVPPAGKESDNLLAPKAIKRVWHLDLTTVQVLFLRVTIAAVIDGFSRKLLAIRLYGKVPRTAQLAALTGRLCRRFGRPKFLVTDHGSQFQKAFHDRVEKLGIKHVRGRVWCPAMNSKIERFFRSLKIWLLAIQMVSDARGMQRRLDHYQRWYNEVRCHAALNGRTPEEAWTGAKLPESIPILQADPIHVTARVTRHAFGGDPRLPVINVDVGFSQRRVA